MAQVSRRLRCVTFHVYLNEFVEDCEVALVAELSAQGGEAGDPVSAHVLLTRAVPVPGSCRLTGSLQKGSSLHS